MRFVEGFMFLKNYCRINCFVIRHVRRYVVFNNISQV